MRFIKQHGQLITGVLVSIISIAAIGIFINPDDILNALQAANLVEVVLGALAIVFYMLLRAVRWQFMLNNTISLWQLFHIQNIGYMLTQLLPFRIGDVARAMLVGNQEEVTTSQGLLTMGVERILDMLLMLLLLPLTLHAVPALPAWLQNTAWVSGLLIGTTVFFLVLITRQQPFFLHIATFLLNLLPFLNTAVWRQRLDNLLGELSSLLTWRKWLTLVLLSLITWLPIVLAYTRIMRAVHLQPTWETAVFVMCVGAFSVAAPSSPGQIGVFHAGVIAAMALLGLPAAPSAALAVLYHAVNFGVMVLLGLIGLFFINVRFHTIWAARRPTFSLPTNQTAHT